MILARILCLAFGYLAGLFQTAYIYGRAHGIDIRKEGSGNAGTTNALRVLGKKAGLIVFLGDLLKAIITGTVICLIMKNIDPGNEFLYMAYGGVGVILGHNFPCYLGFKGGKGIAATAGIVICFLDPYIILSCLILFVSVVAISRYVSLGSIVIVINFAILYSVSAISGRYAFNLDTSYDKMIESVLVVIFITGLAIFRHKDNIVRLIRHEERKIGEKKE